MKFSLVRTALALGAAAALAACGAGGKATYPIRVTVYNALYDGLILSTNGQDYAVPKVATEGASYTFTFPNQIEYGEIYNVVQKTPPAHMSCGPGSIPPSTGTAGQFQSIDISFSCALKTYAIGGKITGLKGTGLVLINGSTASGYTAAPTLDTNSQPTGADITFAMPSAVAYGVAYGVTVLTQPTNPAQTCTVTNNAGTINDAVETAGSVSNILVTCQ